MDKGFIMKNGKLLDSSLTIYLYRKCCESKHDIHNSQHPIKFPRGAPSVFSSFTGQRLFDTPHTGCDYTVDAKVGVTRCQHRYDVREKENAHSVHLEGETAMI